MSKQKKNHFHQTQISKQIKKLLQNYKEEKREKTISNYFIGTEKVKYRATYYLSCKIRINILTSH